MSTRNDTYLSLCIARAELSPLGYRHGAIIVRGGKAISQSFNTYRPGFDDGTLKTGVLPSGSQDDGAMAITPTCHCSRHVFWHLVFSDLGALSGVLPKAVLLLTG
ncbi:hypothetical protein B0O99DRAFT_687931 [Bisporella sp. PMI_857]|nr:hypothetical protein B0O99DRAFT_687931 [Bisporella sp. PMI_857]